MSAIGRFHCTSNELPKMLMKVINRVVCWVRTLLFLFVPSLFDILNPKDVFLAFIFSWATACLSFLYFQKQMVFKRGIFGY